MLDSVLSIATAAAALAPLLFAAAQEAPGPLFGDAVTGINSFNTSLASLLAALLNTTVLIAAGVMLTQMGGKGIQKEVRALAITLFLGAMFIKGYQGLTTGAMGMF